MEKKLLLVTLTIMLFFKASTQTVHYKLNYIRNRDLEQTEYKDSLGSIDIDMSVKNQLKITIYNAKFHTTYSGTAYTLDGKKEGNELSFEMKYEYSRNNSSKAVNYLKVTMDFSSVYTIFIISYTDEKYTNFESAYGGGWGKMNN